MALTMITTTASMIASACAEEVNCAHAPTMSPTSGESSGDTSGFMMRGSLESASMIVCYCLANSVGLIGDGTKGREHDRDTVYPSLSIWEGRLRDW